MILFPFAAADFLNELPEQAVIFFPRFRFYAAGDVNSVGAYNSHCRSYVFDVQAACQYDTATYSGAPGNIPIRGAARTSILACVRVVKQKGKSLGVFIERLQAQIRLDAEGFEDREAAGQFSNGFRGLVAMKLGGIELQWLAQCGNFIRPRLDEN